GQVLPGLNLSKQPGDENTDNNNHGTGMAALIAGTGKRPDGNGSFGLAPGAKILPVKMPKLTEGTKLGQNLPLVNKAMSQGIRYAADRGAKVINISQGLSEGSEELTAAVKYAL